MTRASTSHDPQSQHNFRIKLSDRTGDAVVSGPSLSVPEGNAEPQIYPPNYTFQSLKAKDVAQAKQFVNDYKQVLLRHMKMQTDGKTAKEEVLARKEELKEADRASSKQQSGGGRLQKNSGKSPNKGMRRIVRKPTERRLTSRKLRTMR